MLLTWPSQSFTLSQRSLRLFVESENEILALFDSVDILVLTSTGGEFHPEYPRYFLVIPGIFSGFVILCGRC